MLGGKGKAYLFIAQNGRYGVYIEIVALRAMFSLSMLEHVHCTVNTVHEHSVISMGVTGIIFL
jgi:hypothetical protein